MHLKVQVHRNWTFGSPAARLYFIGKGITLSSGVSLRSMGTWWKDYFISFPMHLISSQYHIGKASKSSRYVVVVSGGCYDIIAGMLFTVGTLAQVRERPKYVERSFKRPKNVLLHGHHHRRPARRPKSSWRPIPSRLRVCFGIQEQPALKRTPRSHTESDLGALYMVGNIILRRF